MQNDGFLAYKTEGEFTVVLNLEGHRDWIEKYLGD